MKNIDMLAFISARREIYSYFPLNAGSIKTPLDVRSYWI